MMSERPSTRENLNEIVAAYGDRVVPCADIGQAERAKLGADVLSQLEPALSELFSDPADILAANKWANAQKADDQSEIIRTRPLSWKTQQCGDYEIRMLKQANSARSPENLPLLTMHLGLHHHTINSEISIADFTIVFFPGNRVGIIHRYIPPQYRATGIGTAFIKGVEGMVQRLADHTQQNHYATVRTAQPSVVVFFQDGRSFVPADENQRERIERMRSGDKGLFLAPAYQELEPGNDTLIQLSDRGLYCFEGSKDSVPVARRLPLTQAAKEHDTAAFAVDLIKEFRPSQNSADVAIEQTRRAIGSNLP